MLVCKRTEGESIREEAGGRRVVLSIKRGKTMWDEGRSKQRHCFELQKYRHVRAKKPKKETYPSAQSAYHPDSGAAAHLNVLHHPYPLNATSKMERR